MLEEQAQREDSSELVRRYRKTGEMQVRDEILFSNLSIVRAAAAQMRSVLNNGIQEEDLINQGVLALMECIDRYDGSKGAKFGTYAFIRVRGSMIDYIRSQDWVPHRVRRLGKKMNTAYMELANQKMREPSVEELAEYMELPRDQIQKNIRDMNHAVLLSFEELLQETGSPSGDFGMEDHSIGRLPEENIFLEELKRELTEGIQNLSEQERLVITLYYYEELKYAEIAEVLEVSESRICQIHTKAILKLRKRMEEYRER